VTRDDTAVVRAAGGIVLRPAGDPALGSLVLVVHRPRYDDWSLPKGKADPGERAEDTALREVHEETGLRCRLGQPAGEVRYRDSRGRAKRVRYWLMEPEADPGEFTPNDEVDEIRWCSALEAADLLSYDHDRRLLASVREELR
jgi:8-oxo-dGTP pyrophosphatase MutT (NUDIX family)